MADVIRDVTIRIGLQQVKAKLEVPDTAPAQQRIDALNNGVKKVNDSFNEQRKKAEETFSKINEGGIRAGDSLKQAGEGAFTLLRGMTFLSAATGVSTEKMIRYVAVAQGGFDVFKGGFEVIKGVSAATNTLAEANRVAAASEFLLAGAATTSTASLRALAAAKLAAAIGSPTALAIGLPAAGLITAGAVASLISPTALDFLGNGISQPTRTQEQQRRNTITQSRIGAATANRDAALQQLDREVKLGELTDKRISAKEQENRLADISLQFQRDLFRLATDSQTTAEKRLALAQNRLVIEQANAKASEDDLRRRRDAVTLAQRDLDLARQKANQAILGRLSVEDQFSALDPLRQRHIARLATQGVGNLNRGQLGELSPFAPELVREELRQRTPQDLLASIGQLNARNAQAAARQQASIEQEIGRSPEVQTAQSHLEKTREAFQAVADAQREEVTLLGSLVDEVKNALREVEKLRADFVHSQLAR